MSSEKRCDMNDLDALDIEKIAKAIEADAGEPLPEIRQALAEAKAASGERISREVMPAELEAA